jgi:hypothetical protein
MTDRSIKIVCVSVIAIVIAASCFHKPRHLEKYREARMIGAKLVTIDACLEPGVDMRKVSHALDDAWQRLREIDQRPGGQVIDETVQRLRRRGLHDFLIDAVGDTYAAGTNCSRRPWTIAVKDPTNKARIVDIVEITNASLSTAFNAAVIAPTVKEGNALAAAAGALPVQKGVALIEAGGKKYAGAVIGRDRAGHPMIYPSDNYKNFQIKKHSK